MIPGELHDLLVKYWTKDFLSDNAFHKFVTLSQQFGENTVIELLRQISTNERYLSYVELI